MVQDLALLDSDSDVSAPRILPAGSCNIALLACFGSLPSGDHRMLDVQDLDMELFIVIQSEDKSSTLGQPLLEGRPPGATL